VVKVIAVLRAVYGPFPDVLIIEILKVTEVTGILNVIVYEYVDIAGGGIGHKVLGEG
jgi:hypothetical protein